MTGIALQSKFGRASLWAVELDSSWHILLTKAVQRQAVLWPQGVTLHGGPMSSCMVWPLCHTSVCSWGHGSHPRIILELFMCDCFQWKLKTHHFTESGAYSIASLTFKQTAKKKSPLTPKKKRNRLKILCLGEGGGGWFFCLPFWVWAVNYVTMCPWTYHAYSHATILKRMKGTRNFPSPHVDRNRNGKKNKMEKLDYFEECGLWICNPEVRWILQSLKLMLKVLALEKRNIMPTRPSFMLIFSGKFYFLQCNVSQDIRAQPVLHGNNKILSSLRWGHMGDFLFENAISKISVV